MTMKNILLLAILLLSISYVDAQDSKWPKLDASVMDAATYPSNAAWRNYMGEDERNLNPQAKVVYSRPLKKGREIFGGLIPYGQEWRLGANEATTITFYQTVGIGESVIPRGRYSVFAVVNQDSWTVNFSTETYIWGNANRDQNATVASIEVPVKNTTTEMEALSMAFQEINENLIHFVIAWDKTHVAVPIELNPVIFSHIDVSPMDMVHYPDASRFNNYREAGTDVVEPKMQVSYSRPAKKNRNIFGELLPEGTVWRIGANEATEVTFFQDVTIMGKTIKRGRYAMFAKLNGDTWDIIFSTDLPIWGAANRDESKDVAMVTITPSSDAEVVENLAIIIDEKSENLVHLVVAWDTTRAEIPITF